MKMTMIIMIMTMMKMKESLANEKQRKWWTLPRPHGGKQSVYLLVAPTINQSAHYTQEATHIPYTIHICTYISYTLASPVQ